MNNKKPLLGILLLSTMFLVSCGGNPTTSTSSSANPNTSKDEPTSEITTTKDESSEELSSSSSSEKEPEPTFKNSIELYKKSVETMAKLTYEINSFGVSITDISGNGHPLPDPLYIYENLKHKENELYFEKISNGKPVMGFQGVSFAQKAYIKDNIGRRASAENKNPWDPYDTTTPEKNYPNVNNYKEAYDKAPNEILAEFGKTANGYCSFTIDSDTVTPESLTFTKTETEYDMSFALVIDNGIESKSIAGYKDQVMTMSGKPLKSVESINVNIKLDNKFRVKSFSTKELYTVNFIVDAKVDNTLTYNFTYFDNPSDLVITAF